MIRMQKVKIRFLASIAPEGRAKRYRFEKITKNTNLQRFPVRGTQTSVVHRWSFRTENDTYINIGKIYTNQKKKKILF